MNCGVPLKQRIVPESSWWYGVAVVPILTAVVWIAHFGAEAGFPLLSVITGIGLVFVGGLLVPLFSVSLIMDVRALNQSEGGWNPSKPLYYLVAAIHVFGFVTPLVYVATLFGATAYLTQRHNNVGSP